MLWVDHRWCCGAEGVAKNPVDANAHQADTDDGDDGACHHWREKPQHAADQRCNQDRDSTRTNDGAKNELSPSVARVRTGHGHHGSHGGKGHTHHDGQANAKPLGSAPRLDEGDQATHKQVSRDEHGHLFGAELQSTADDEWHSHSACIHDKYVLQAEGGELAGGQVLVDGMGGLGHGCSLGIFRIQNCIQKIFGLF